MAIIEPILGEIIGGVGGGAAVGGDCSWNWRGSDIAGLYQGIFQAYPEVEIDKEHQIDHLTPELKVLFAEAITCWQLRLCSDDYSKGSALADAGANIEENKTLDSAAIAADFQDAIEDGVATLANYRIPEIISAQNANRAYESTCATLLKCDLGFILANELESDLDNAVNAAVQIHSAQNNWQSQAEELKLRYIQVYAESEIGRASALARFYDDAVRSYEYFDTIKNISETSLNGDDLVIELLATVLGSVLITTIVDELFGTDLQNIAAVMPDCGTEPPTDPVEIP